MKYLIINADDYGYSKSINRGIIDAYNQGVVTSTSVMVYGKAVDEVLKLKHLKNLSVGLHLHMEETIENPEMEFNKQINLFIQLYGKEPSHIDIHKPRSSDVEQVKDLLKNYSIENKIPIRGSDAKLIKDFFGLNTEGDGEYVPDRISVENLLKVLSNLDEGMSEIMCHVGYSDDELRKLSSYSDAREIELKSLTDPEVLNYIKNQKDLELVNWSRAWNITHK